MSDEENKQEWEDKDISYTFQEIKEQLNRIEDQVVKTNSRVTKLELWKSKMLGAIAILSAFVLPLFFIMIKNL